MSFVTATSPEQIPPEVRMRFWMRLLDGDSISEIARYSYQDFAAAGAEDVFEATPSAVRQVLGQDPPQEIASDPRYVHRVRAFWIGADYGGGNGEILPMVFAFQPWRLPARTFQTALRNIRREFAEAHPEGTINLQVVEGVEMDVCLRLIAQKKYAAWIVDADGRVRAYAGEFAPETDASPAPR